jgi:hypothetical protein
VFVRDDRVFKVRHMPSFIDALSMVDRYRATITLFRSWLYNVHHVPIASINFSQRHILAGSGIDLMSQQGIAVERFAVLRFRRFLANARLQSHVVDSVQGIPHPIEYTRI